MSNMKYRSEIDGLRALAILPVILFHAGFQTFSGGFVGVDVFFVISGYLITTLILKEKETNNFSIVNFYERRARRILPALFFVMIICVIFSWIYLLPSEMKLFGQSITASAAFVANIYFYEKNNDYFGLHSEQNPTLHLWSLSVEEQYYVIFPLFLLLMWRFGRTWIVYVLMGGATISLIIAQWSSAHNPSAAFFLLPSRGWELLLGSFIAFSSETQKSLNKNHSVNQVLSILGITLIVFSIFYFDKYTPFPSVWALIPTLGAALIIMFSTKDTFSAKLFGNKVLVGIGLISFSAYLWHQPLFAFNRILSYQEPSKISFLGLSILALIFAFLTWQCIEKPFRAKNRFSRATIFSVSIVGSMAFILFGILGHINSGYPERDPFFKRLVNNVGLSLKCNGNTSINATCSTSATPEFAFLGNSYAMHLVDGFKTLYPDKSFVQLTQDSCSPYSYSRVGETKNAGKLACSEFLNLALSTIRNTASIKTVFISSPFGDLVKDENVQAFEKTIKNLLAANKRVIIIGAPPSNGTNFGKCFMHHQTTQDFEQCNFKRKSLESAYFDSVSRLKSLALKNNIKFLDLTNILCDTHLCKTSVGDILIYRDSGHLSVEGSYYVFKQLAHDFSLNHLLSHN